ncbi:Holliday junction branch migration protein RuvA [Cellulosimicrobium sp. BIT-GX5]|uniref:Holliday junction branch migration complex subunit RuvA n=1 Tax=Cellulosimicrobium composti TaxID=2672572 RepID=A0A6N7ZM76_9MICO|nr:Holliday junction branch migration protein RuvA [Cellulosimicrobium composti]MTG90450.1 Holliday junction branch migration protein RuvA [Cellulosimicrobium composti]TWG87383.1 Holliday junction DNA helicase subunit RuvA [Cellulosimicrobium cellulans J34]SMF00838.1 Holliday junction DNA helicase subunit RuvA [Cellulosimicrobium cellulans J1]
MIASLSGVVASVQLDRAVLEVSGVGYLVHATPATLAGLRVGETARLATSLVVREDSFTLYGFADDDERAVFETVQTVSGVGPRLALAMLAVHTPDALRRAVAGGDIAALVRVPGIGKKGAQRIALELGDKLGPPTGADAPEPGAAASGAPRRVDDRRDQVVEALVGLGWNLKAADDAVATVLAEAGVDIVEAPDVAGALRAALRVLGGPRG